MTQETTRRQILFSSLSIRIKIYCILNCGNIYIIIINVEIWLRADILLNQLPTTKRYIPPPHKTIKYKEDLAE